MCWILNNLFLWLAAPIFYNFLPIYLNISTLNLQVFVKAVSTEINAFISKRFTPRAKEVLLHSCPFKKLLYPTNTLFISQYKYKYKYRYRYTGTNTNTVGLSKSFFIQAARFLLITLFDMLTIVIFGRIILIVFQPFWSKFEEIPGKRCGRVKMHLVGKFWHYGVYCTFLFYSRRSLSALTGALYITLRSCWNPFFFFTQLFGALDQY